MWKIVKLLQIHIRELCFNDGELSGFEAMDMPIDYINQKTA